MEMNRQPITWIAGGVKDKVNTGCGHDNCEETGPRSLYYSLRYSNSFILKKNSIRMDLASSFFRHIVNGEGGGGVHIQLNWAGNLLMMVR